MSDGFFSGQITVRSNMADGLELHNCGFLMLQTVKFLGSRSFGRITNRDPERSQLPKMFYVQAVCCDAHLHQRKEYEQLHTRKASSSDMKRLFSTSFIT